MTATHPLPARLVCLPAVALLLAAPLRADTAALTFEKDVQPLLRARCVQCHGEKTRRGDLSLVSHAALMRGGESGPVVVPGKPEKSLLHELVHKGEMPRGKERLGAAEVDLLRRWIEAGAPSASAGVSQPEVTQHDVEPLLLLRCATCHGLRRQEGGLDLRTRASMLRGGKSGPAMVPGKPEESVLLSKVHDGTMPPRDQLIRAGVRPMTEGEIDLLTRWIARGAPEVEIEPDVASAEGDPLVTERDRQHWAFQPPRAVTPPAVRSDRVRTPIDAFLLEKLREKGLDFAPEADRLTLIRRASFDLTGLPPSPEEVDRFLADRGPDAWERLIDRLLDSPRYGERWGRHWLDLAGYADSEGKRSADPIRPHAWRYRDYVIRAFNEDRPYDRFLLEQLAGDELVRHEGGPITPEVMTCLTATGFLRMAPDGTGSDVVNTVVERLEVVADQLQILGASVLGLTLHCARCHSHKYDPIPQRDYYRLAAVFKGAYDEHDWLKPTVVRGQSKGSVASRVLARVSDEEKERWQQYQEVLRAKVAALKAMPQDDAVRRQLRALENNVGVEPAIRALWDRGEPSPTYIYRRGDPLQPSRLVGPGVLSVLTDGHTPFAVEPPYPGATSTGRRLALARWLTRPDHPLTARVFVNQLWYRHFGAGLVRTPANFGTTGERPSHPELLDWLARTFVKQSWSIKAMHRLIMTSSAYRQGSAVTDAMLRLDPENRLVSRMPLRRMDAEEVRDTLLLLAGKLAETPFGPPDLVDLRADGLVTAFPNEQGLFRRSIYVLQRRSQVLTLLETFDLPQMNPACTARTESTVASQALHLMNNALVEELAGALAGRVADEVGDRAADQIESLYRLALCRPPSAEERQLGVEGLAQLRQHWMEAGKAGEEARRRALAGYAHTLLNTAAFVYID